MSTTMSAVSGIAGVLPAPLRFHARLVQMAAAADELLPHRPLVLAEHRVVAVVELLDDLERPAVGEHVAPDELALDPLGQLGLTTLPHELDGLVEPEVGLADELVKAVEVPAGAFQGLQGLGHLAGGLDGGFFRFGHRARYVTISSPRLTASCPPSRGPRWPHGLRPHPRAGSAGRSPASGHSPAHSRCARAPAVRVAAAAGLPRHRPKRRSPSR